MRFWDCRWCRGKNHENKTVCTHCSRERRGHFRAADDRPLLTLVQQREEKGLYVHRRSLDTTEPGRTDTPARPPVRGAR